MMEILYTILALMGGTFVILLLIGFFVNDEQEKQVDLKSNSPDQDALSKYRSKQKSDLVILQEERPSVIRSSVLMWLIQIVASFGILCGVGLIIYFLIDKFLYKEDYGNDYLFVSVIITAFMIFIHYLATSVRRRNRYILRVEELIEKD